MQQEMRLEKWALASHNRITLTKRVSADSIELLPLPLLAIRVVPQITAVRAPVFLVIRAVPLDSAAVEYAFREKT